MKLEYKENWNSRNLELPTKNIDEIVLFFIITKITDYNMQRGVIEYIIEEN